MLLSVRHVPDKNNNDRNNLFVEREREKDGVCKCMECQSNRVLGKTGEAVSPQLSDIGYHSEE